jgi:putative ABC transport system permease protein
MTAAQSYLAVRLQESSAVAPVAPFVVAFALIGLVTSVLIVINVVSGAVAAGYRRIGILKSIGFTPGQVTGVYAGQVLVPAAGGCLAGVVLGNVLAVPLLSQTASVYGVGTLLIPAWVDLAVPAALCGLTGLAALLPALRAGRLSAVQAIATGRAPRAHHGHAAHRLLSKLPLPRPVTIGLAEPFARPARTAVSTIAILLGAMAVTCAVGLSSSLTKVADGLTHTTAEPVQVYLRGAGGGPQGPAGSGSGGPQGVRLPSQAVQERTVEAALRHQPGTLRFAAVTTLQVSVAGITQQVPLTAFRGTSDWTGYDMISGRWYRQPGEVDVPTSFLTVTGTTVGDTVAITAGHKRIQVRIVGEVFDTTNHGLAMFTGWQTLTRLSPGVTPSNYEIRLRPGTPAGAYERALSGILGPDYAVNVNATSPFLLTLIGLIGTLVLLLAVMAGLGVLNTVVMHTRERVHDLGIFKAIGMTPGQTIAMIVSLVAGPGLLAGLLAVPAGIAVHHQVLPAMASAAGTRVPASFLDVYRPAELLLLALAGLIIATAGALLPAGWAARTRTAAAIRAE